MRALVVEDLDEVVEAGLLLEEISTGRLGGFLFRGEMHAFMAAILLWMAGLDSFNADSEPEPPDRQLTEVESSVRGSEGNAIIAAPVGWQATLLKTMRQLSGKPAIWRVDASTILKPY